MARNINSMTQNAFQFSKGSLARHGFVKPHKSNQTIIANKVPIEKDDKIQEISWGNFLRVHILRLQVSRVICSSKREIGRQNNTIVNAKLAMPNFT